uniref:C2H2-type domain-containing protein n=1 Tax=Ditylenchus dipsaci TaxID=166011 RepID=A0A915ERN9_9BILA
MEGGNSINPTMGFDIASMLGKLTNAKSPTKSMIGEPNSAAAINQQIRDIISHYAASSSAATSAATSASTSAISCQPVIGASSSIVVGAEEGQLASTSAFPSSNTRLEMGNAEEDIGEAKSRGTRQIHCSECPRVLLSRKNFIKHAEDEHGMVLPIIYKNFDSQQEFDKWISYLREERNTEFVSKCGRKRLSNGSLLGYLVCAKSGSEAWKSRKKTAKSLKTCSAYLKVLRNEITGRIEIEGCLDHTGHEFSLIPGKGDDLDQNGEGWIGEGVPFSEVCAQIEARRVGEASYLNCHPQPGEVQVDVLTSNSLDPANNPNTEAMLTSFLTMLKQKEFKPNVMRPNQQLTPDNTASSSTEVVSQKAVSSLAAPGKTLSNTYVNVELERRKLAMLEQFQTTIRQINEQSIDGAEVAMKFFLREMETLNKENYGSAISHRSDSGDEQQAISRKHKAYSTEWKLTVIKHAKQISKKAASKKFNISRTTVIDWVKQESQRII